LLPQTEPLQPQFSNKAIPLYKRIGNTQNHFELGFGQMPFTKLSTKSVEHLTEVVDPDTTIQATCIIGTTSRSCMNWSTLELGWTRTQWINALPRSGFDVSARTIIDIYRPQIGLNSIRPHLYLSAGWRWQPSPSPLFNNNSRLWGPSNSNHFSRHQYGIRGGLIIGDGLESKVLPLIEDGSDLGETVVVEGWSAWSSGNSRRRFDSTLPYTPKWLLGTYAQLQLGFDIQDEGATQGTSLFDGSALFVGIRGSWKLDR
jgi:hypothetical protein